jgi:monoamine oxidase
MREYALAKIGSGSDASPPSWTRREVLRMGGALGAGMALAACTPGARSSPSPASPSSRPTPHDPRVVVVGAGLAGLTAAYRLAQAGVAVQVYESRDRVGGRCWTARGFADGQTAEHGGEFIDTRHVHLLGLADELGLDLDDLNAGWVPGSIWPNWLGGEVVLGKDLHEQLDPIVAAVEQEARRIGVIATGRPPSIAAISYGTATPQAAELDELSMAEWLDGAVPGVVGSPLGDYLDESMSGWYGLEMDQLSACTWMDYFVLPAPGADERWHVTGGNDQVPALLADELPDGALHLDAPLASLRARGDGPYELRFDGVGDPVVGDIVVLALPFTTLRLVDLEDSGFDAQRRAAILGLGMGMDVKLFLQYERRPAEFTVDGRPWSGGMEHTNPHFETWESSVEQPGSSGLITVYAGGRTGASWTADEPHAIAPEAFAAEYVGHIDEVVPGTAASFNGQAWLDLWTRDPWTNGAYAAFLPNQYTRLWGYTGRAEGNVHFAGEHTSTYSQGYLNGGVESGQRAAIEVLRDLGIDVPPSIAALPYSEFG